METRFKYESSMVCKRCGKRFDWYCLNMSLLPRTREPIGYSIPNGSHMVVNRYEPDGTPVFKGVCTHCGFTNQLPQELLLEIPEEIYTKY